MKSIRLLCIPAGICLALSGCRDNPQLVRKSREQATEIDRLKAELAVLQDQLKDVPKDQSKALELAKAEEATQSIKLTELEQEVARLKAERDKAKAGLEAFINGKPR